MIFVLIGAAALSAAINWWAVATNRRAVESVAKPLTLVLFLATALAAGAAGSVVGVLLLVGLFFGLLGDIALLGRSEPRFIAGLSAFLVGHIAYVVALAMLFAPVWGVTIAGAVAVGALLVVVRPVLARIWRTRGAALGAACIVYAGVIAAMGVAAWLTGDVLTGVGASVFMVSDALLARGVARGGEFDATDPRERTAVMVTYHVGQAALVAGALIAIG